MATRVNVLVVRAAGINCDEEIMHAWRLAGAEPALVHINQLVASPAMLDDVQIVTFPGGFSYGDDIAAGAIFAQRVVHELLDPLRALVGRGGGLLGICNGFQVLTKTGLLPAGDIGAKRVTVTFNDSAKFEARWVTMRVATDRCVYLKPGDNISMPVEHAEGKVIVRDDATLTALQEGGYVALQYVDEDGHHDSYPANPNGSVAGIAGLCDDTGRVLGLMPHPDRHFAPTHHPCWTRNTALLDREPDGLAVFRRAVAHWSAGN